MNPFYFINDLTKYVYHYTSCETLVRHILPSGKLRLSPFADMNDPREYKTWTFNLYSRCGFEKTFNHSAIETQASDLIKRDCKLLCTTLDGPHSADDSTDNIYDRGYCRPRMWAQYAEKHRGVCLVFDRQKLDHNIRVEFSRALVIAGKVAYRNRPRSQRLDIWHAFLLDYDNIRDLGMEKAVAVHFSQHHNELFLEKGADWADEREYRWIVRDFGSGECLVDFGESLVGILFGDNCSSENREKIHALTDQNVSIGILNWKSGVPEVLPSILPGGITSGWTRG